MNYVSIKLLFLECLPYSSPHLIEDIFGHQHLNSYFRNPEQGPELMVPMTERVAKGKGIDLKYGECAEVVCVPWGWLEVSLRRKGSEGI